MQIEGKNAVSELIASGQKIDKLYVDKTTRGDRAQQLIEQVRADGGKVEFLDAAALDRRSMTHRHQGWIAVTREFEYATLDDILFEPKNKQRLILLLDGVEDPHNLGACVRVAECAGVDGLVIPERRAAQVNETVVRVAAGATAHVKIARVGNLNDAIRRLKKEGVRVIGAELGGHSVYQENFCCDTALIIGSEGTGIHRLTKELCDAVVTLPMYGEVNSLNASVACGVMVYEVLRQRLS